MKSTIFAGILLLFISLAGLGQNFDPYSCTFKGINLYGKVEVVDHNPDIRVEVVSSFPDIVVDSNASWTSKCGEWKMVTSNADFRVQFVRSGSDLKVKFDHSWPGVPDSRKTSQKSQINSFHCSYKGKPLYGKVKIVENFPDIKVKVVNSFPDLKVEVVDNFPDQCGKWQFVESFPDSKSSLLNRLKILRLNL
jgi:hypothetical protein